MTAETIARAVSSVRFNFSGEAELQCGVEALLREQNIQFLREFRLSPYGRLDFLCDGVAVETKIKGPWPALSSRSMWSRA